MPQPIEDQLEQDDILHEWTTKEYEQPARKTRWFVVMGIISGILIFYGLVKGNFLFSLIIMLFFIVLFLQSHQKPPLVGFAITPIGVVVGNRLYEYAELKQFYIIYQPPQVEMLYIETTGISRPMLRIPLMDQDPIEIRDTLLQFLPENADADSEPGGDKFGRDWLLQ
ncbi:MAG: hypothetical protein HOE53_01135 [Candidatus Magasanikbacteria bacterium]|jgi:hypothetical protein|nr:hypothetical protein [Candidatus Magasanikbacteria bacterium]